MHISRSTLISRTKCRHRLEVLELWLRRLVHDKLSNAYGANYLDHEIGGQYIFRGDTRRRAKQRMSDSPGRYSRPVDALILDDLVRTLCKPQLFNPHFRDALARAFPEGNAEAKTFLDRLVAIRNPLSHANPISYHQASRVFCYTEDVVDSIRHYYMAIGREKEFNAPMFAAFRDSTGNSATISDSKARLRFDTMLRPGIEIRFEADIDDSFSADECTIAWRVANISQGESGQGRSFVLDILPKHVGEEFAVTATLVSNKNWHRHQNFDARLIATYTVLPPL